MSADHLDSGFTTSSRGSITSDDSFQSERSISSYSDNTLNISDIKVKGRDKPKARDIFGHLPDQVYKKAVRKGFEFSLMVVGESGLGKSTLVNSMFLKDIYEKEEVQNEMAEDQTVQVETHQTVLEENGVRLALTVVDTPGFGDAVDNTDCWQPIIEYVEKQFEDYLESETKVERVEVPDTKVHACLYFIAPTGHGLKPLDIQCMKRIHEKVNIIPVIGKADSCTKKEINLFKRKVKVKP
jgi:septin 7